MIKNYNTRKLSRTSSHRLAMLRNMSASLFQHEKITTTLSKAKEVARFSEKILSTARSSDLNARRSVARHIKDEMVIKKLFDVLGPRFKGRAGGYTQILRVGRRKGDAAETAVVRLLA